MASVRKQIKINLPRIINAEMERKDMVNTCRSVSEALDNIWYYLDNNSKEELPASYSMIAGTFGKLDRKKVEEVFRYALPYRASKRKKALEDSKK